MGLFSSAEVALISGGIRPPAPKDYRLPETFPSFNKAKRICLDLEGKDPSIANDTGPGWRRDAFICGFSVALGDDKGGIEFSEYYPCRHKGGPNLDEARLFDWLRDELAFFSGEITGANLLYDADGFQYQKIYAPLAKWRDVQWAEALIDENAFNYYLQRLAKRYTGHGKETDELKALYGPDYKERMDEVHPGHMRAYGRGDVELPMQILNLQFKELRKQKLEDVYDLECRLLPMLLYMRRKGQPVDLAAAEKLHDSFTIKRTEALRDATKALGKRGFEVNPENFGKPSVLGAALDHLGLVYPKTPKTGQPSVSNDWLEAQEHPFCGFLATANKYDKALETFVNGYVTDYAINGRVHCEFHPLKSVNGKGKSNGTVAGRFSAVNPNLQNIPVRDKVIGPLCRAMFVPEDGYDFFSGDYCVDPQTRLLKASLEWQSARDIPIGAEVVSSDEQPTSKTRKMKQRFLRRATVVAKKFLKQPCVRITTDKGSVVCSTRHKWLVRTLTPAGFLHNCEWLQSESIKIGDAISFIATPWETDTSNEAGYLAGLFDGEGQIDLAHCSFNQKSTGDNAIVLEKGKNLLIQKGFDVHHGDGGATDCIRILGGREELLRFIGSIRPERLFAKSACIWEGCAVRSRSTTGARVVSIEYLGEQEVVAIETSKKTFIAEGFVSHNSQIEYREIVHAAVLRAQLPKEKAVKLWGLKNGADIWERLQSAFKTQQAYINDPTTDFHQFMATLTGLERKYAKSVNFAVAFVMGLQSFAETLGQVGEDGKPNEKAIGILNTYHAAVPFVKAVGMAMTYEAYHDGYTSSLRGRRAHYDRWEPKFQDRSLGRAKALPIAEAEEAYGKDKIKRSMTHAALNRYTQMGGADLMKTAMVMAWESGLLDSDELIISLTVHDELDGSVARSKQGRERLRELQNMMEHAITLTLPTTTEFKVGANWAETH
jgi:DNA polymerase-1